MAQTHARRAAKQKRRAHRNKGGKGPTPPRFGFDDEVIIDLHFDEDFDDHPFTLDPVALATDALGTAAAHVAAGRTDAYALRDLEPMWQASWEAVGTATDRLLAALVEGLHRANWLPSDIVEVSRRRLELPARELLIDAVREVGARNATIRQDRAWAADLVALGPSPWRSARSRFAHRVAAETWDRGAAVRAVVRVLADTMEWPQLQAVGTNGGGAESSADTAMLAKVRALLAKAESTMFEHEAEAYTAKAQALMARHAIDQALLATKPSTASSVARVWIDAPYVVAKSLLVDAVARANRCRSVLAERMGFCTVVGEATDVRAAVLLITSLQVQAVRALARLGSPRRGYGAPSTQSFRQSFLVAFATRIGERLTEVNTAEEHATVDSSRLLPVLAARSQAADERFEQLFPALVSKSVATSSFDGLQAGRAAADLAQLAYGEQLEPTGTS